MCCIFWPCAVSVSEERKGQVLQCEFDSAYTAVSAVVAPGDADTAA